MTVCMKASGSMPAMGTLRIYTTLTEIASAMSGAVPAIWIVQRYAFVVYLFLGAFYIGGVLGLAGSAEDGLSAFLSPGRPTEVLKEPLSPSQLVFVPSIAIFQQDQMGVLGLLGRCRFYPADPAADPAVRSC